MADPARLDYATGGDGRAAPWLKRLAAALALYPLLLLLAVYGGWLAAWVHLGHRPRPALDDPRFGDAALGAAVVPAAMLLLAAWPVFIVYLALVGVVFYRSLTPGNPATRRLAILVGAVLPWALAFVLLNADPGNVLKWSALAPPSKGAR